MNSPTAAPDHRRASDATLPTFRPARIRIHPLTRLDRGADRPTRLIVHIELLDRWGLPVRALGTLRLIARFDAPQTARIAESIPGFTGVAGWTIDMTDPDANATRFYDRVTRTYRIPLSHAAFAYADAPFTLEAFFEAPGLAVLPVSATISP